MSLNLKNDILNVVRGGYQPISDPSTNSVNWSKLPTTGSNTYKLNSKQVEYVNESNSKRIKSLTRKNKDLQDRIKELEQSVEHLHKVIDTIGVKERFYYGKLKDLGYNPDATYAVGHYNKSQKDVKVSRVPRVTPHKVKIKNCFKSKSKGSH